MPKPKFESTIDYNICGIPCLIGVDRYVSVPGYLGSPQHCWSDLDYYGYSEMEYQILDRKGYLAPWLERKITPEIKDGIEMTITDFYSDRDYDYYD